jgi:hypothetical protein
MLVVVVVVLKLILEQLLVALLGLVVVVLEHFIRSIIQSKTQPLAGQTQVAEVEVALEVLVVNHHLDLQHNREALA